jgi:hypothetical protein
MTDNLVQAEATDAERSLPLDEATPPLCPTPMPRQVILFWTPRVFVAETLQALKGVALKGMRYQGRAYQRVPVAMRNIDERR